MENRKIVRNNIEKRLSEIYETVPNEYDKDRLLFTTKGSVYFKLDTISDPLNGVVVEYAENIKQASYNFFGDGDCFGVEEMTEEEIYEAVIREIQEAEEEYGQG